MGGFIAVLIGANLIGPVADSIYNARYGAQKDGNVTNVTGAAATILQLSVLFFALGVMTSGVALAISGLKSAGLV